MSQEEVLSDSQLEAFINTPTQDNNPVVLARSQEVEDALQPLPLEDWLEEVENSFQESMEEQAEGPMDQVHSPHSGQSLPREDS